MLTILYNDVCQLFSRSVGLTIYYSVSWLFSRSVDRHVNLSVGLSISVSFKYSKQIILECERIYVTLSSRYVPIHFIARTISVAVLYGLKQTHTIRVGRKISKKKCIRIKI